LAIALVVVIALLALIGLVFQFAPAIFGALLAAGLGAVVAITADDGPGAFSAAILGVTLLLAAESAFWSLEIPIGRKDDAAAVLNRLGGIAILAGASLIMAVGTVIVAETPIDGGIVTSGAALAAAVVVLGSALWWNRRVNA
jgi:hypothetical protein